MTVLFTNLTRRCSESSYLCKAQKNFLHSGEIINLLIYNTGHFLMSTGLCCVCWQLKIVTLVGRAVPLSLVTTVSYKCSKTSIFVETISKNPTNCSLNQDELVPKSLRNSVHNFLKKSCWHRM